jgi:hypothetical protein
MPPLLEAVADLLAATRAATMAGSSAVWRVLRHPRRQSLSVEVRAGGALLWTAHAWDREDEFYNYKYINPDLHVLIDIDEKSYEGGTNGDNHPMSWYHEYDGGRAWYTNMGHTEATYSEPLFLQHLRGGLRYAMGTGTIDYSRARPEENRFTRVVLAEKLDEPVELAVLPGEQRLRGRKRTRGRGSRLRSVDSVDERACTGWQAAHRA